MLFNPYAIRIRVDGSCYKNPGGASGCAAIVYFPEHLNHPEEQILDFGCSESSINRMELMACIRALEWLRQNRPWPGVERAQIITDSLYVKDHVLQSRRWKKNRWRNRFGKPIQNHDLWKQLIAAHSKAGIAAEIVYEKGKSTEEAKLIDRAAKTAAKRGGIDVDRGFAPGSISRPKTKGVAKPYPASGQLEVIRPYIKRLVYKGENRVSFETFDETTKGYVGKFYAFATPATALILHRHHGYRVRFNSDPNYPCILESLEEVALPRVGESHEK